MQVCVSFIPRLQSFTKFPSALLKMVRVVVLNNTNFKTLVTIPVVRPVAFSLTSVQDHASCAQTEGAQVSHPISLTMIQLMMISNDMACKILDYLIDSRLYREENQVWIEKGVITRVWAGTTNSHPDGSFEALQNLFDSVLQNAKVTLTAPATHAAQTVRTFFFHCYS
jgi:hypothetical protein